MSCQPQCTTAAQPLQALPRGLCLWCAGGLETWETKGDVKVVVGWHSMSRGCSTQQWLAFADSAIVIFEE